MTYFLFKSVHPFASFSETNEQHLIFIYKIMYINIRFVPATFLENIAYSLKRWLIVLDACEMNRYP